MTAKWGHQVATRFAALQLRQLDALVERARKENTGPYQVSRSSVLLDLVAKASEGLSLGPAERDERQLELLEAKRSEQLAPAVDQVERQIKRLSRMGKVATKKAKHGRPVGWSAWKKKRQPKKKAARKSKKRARR